MKWFRKIFTYLYENPVRCTFLTALVLGTAYGIYNIVITPTQNRDFYSQQLFGLGYVVVLISVFLISPPLLTLYNLLHLVCPARSPKAKQASLWLEGTTVIFGALCVLLYFSMTDVLWDKNWYEQLYNDELHTAVATWTLPTVITIATVAMVGYLLLRLRRITKLPPLAAVFAIGGIYLGIALCTIWIIQIYHETRWQMLPLCLYPFNLILVALKTMIAVIGDYLEEEHPLPTGKTPLILALHRLLQNAKHWPWLGVVCAIPLLGILIAVLTLFGQAPDSIIQAWTQTSDWTFSQQVAPQNIYKDMHYLCTVSAGGHPKLVKPIREGTRHGHKVLVNRQLCIANAFEQLLEERLPRTHRFIRRIYDRYGYPIAKHIRSPYVADVVWLLMKPLEWFFLMVLYLFDPKPENRIAVQYPHAPIPKQ